MGRTSAGHYRFDELLGIYAVNDERNGSKISCLQEDKAAVKVLKSTDRWYGVTYKEDKESVVSAIKSMKENGIYPEILWK